MLHKSLVFVVTLRLDNFSMEKWIADQYNEKEYQGAAVYIYSDNLIAQFNEPQGCRDEPLRIYSSCSNTTIEKKGYET